MRQEPRSQQRTVTLVGVDVNVFVHVFAIPVDDVLELKVVVFPEWVVGSKPVGIDGERLLLAARQQESNR